MAKASYWKYVVYALFLGFVAAVVVSLAFVHNLMQEGENYSLAMAQDMRELKTRLMELENIFPGLFSSPYMRNDDLTKELHRQDVAMNQIMERIANIFHCDLDSLNNLRLSVEKLTAAKERAATHLQGNMSYELAATYYRNTIQPYVRNVSLALNAASESSDKYASDIHCQIQNLMNLSILSSIVAGLLIVFLTMYFDRRMEKDRQALAYRESMFQQLANSIDEIFIIASSSNNFDYVSGNTKRLIHISAEEILRHPDKFYAMLGETGGVWLRNALNGEQQNPMSELDIEVHGLLKCFKLRVYAICVTATQQERFIVVISDQTSAMRHQQALNDALENANAASAAKSRFLSHMSHEIRTPMNAIIGMTTIALSRIDDKKRVIDCLGKVSESSRHLLGLINDVLDMSKIEAGKLAICNEKFNLHQLIDNIGSMARPQASSRHQNFEILVENVDEEYLIGDLMRLKQIFINILSNAFKFTPDGGRIVMKLEQIGKTDTHVKILFSIADTGIGMSTEFLERIYRPFEQASEKTASKFGGTGLGMPITFNLVAMMGGSINVTSKEFVGTTFFVEIPFALTDENHAHDYSLEPLRVLVVDDDASTCEHAVMLLERMGMRADFALSGAAAMEKSAQAATEQDSYKIFLIDWVMPGMSGAEVVRKLRDMPGHDAQVIICSAYDWADIESDVLEAGVVQFVAKPFFASNLHESILAASRRLDKTEQKPFAVASGYDFGGSRVLLVEDNEFNREIAQEFLEMINIEVEYAGDGREAVAKVEASPADYYNLVLMDVQMPVMGGYDATRAIRASAHPEARTLPIVAMTANAFSEDVAHAIASGMNAHLAKPIDIEELYRTLAKYLHNKSCGDTMEENNA